MSCLMMESSGVIPYACKSNTISFLLFCIKEKLKRLVGAYQITISPETSCGNGKEAYTNEKICRLDPFPHGYAGRMF